jgi:hypothetical protein
MVESLNGLWHDAVVSRDDQYHYVGDLGPPSPHGRERFMARGVDEGHHCTVWRSYLVSTDVLGDPARLSGRYVGFAYAV